VIKEYVHVPLGLEIRSVSGGYVLDREERISVLGREALCIAGVGIADTACCGMGGSRYAMVPGWVVEWKTGADGDGLAVSLVSRISDKDEQAAVAEAIKRVIGNITSPVQFL
jgi:hypothetical protein